MQASLKGLQGFNELGLSKVPFASSSLWRCLGLGQQKSLPKGEETRQGKREGQEAATPYPPLGTEPD